MNFKTGQPMRPHEGQYLLHETGRSRTTSVMNFGLPRAGDSPQFYISFMEVSSKAGPQGVTAGGID